MENISLCIFQYLTLYYIINSYINTSGNCENEKLCGNMTPEGWSFFHTISSFPNSVHEYLALTLA